MAVDPELLDWLLDSDPALRWQVQRDLGGAPPSNWEATRAKVRTEGFGARLLTLQDPDGQWAGGAYFPADFDFEGLEASADAGQPYTATTWSLNMLREWGLEADALRGTAEKLAANSRWEYENLPYWDGEVDCCINAFTLANGAWLGADVAGLAEWFLEHQQDDGGWNCEWVEGSTRSSFHSTINSLKGLLSYEAAIGGSRELRAARNRGQEYLLERRLLYRKTTGEPVATWASRFVYPFRWFYSALNALDYFRAAALHDAAAPDPRLAEAVSLVRSARQADGTWVQERRHPGRVWFETDVPPGQPSKWLTFTAMRVLDWWDQGGAVAPAVAAPAPDRR
ncbi:squalene cyclase [Pseudarthrobacter sp. AG30]|uniref:squalene cyclase n=1 Tax=Pseudarthrobacter sp. AG30 TaxID=2249742 RepID=UPI000D6DFBF7|nr:squalene cyclase [Pseudarthrobacter sp. AG30]RAX16011.1 squalene cyclase [Pseudarthrobacter sp. AG30]